MSRVTINGITYRGDHIDIVNNKVYIDGKEETPEDKEITIVVHGAVMSINADACNQITINGSAGEVKSMSGNIVISGDVHGNVKNMSGNITCRTIAGSAKTLSGNITS